MEQVREERILVTVKTYPTLSQKYGETVCTAGVREDGSWVRLYPVPFRRLDEEEHYKKYDWLACRVMRKTKDSRPETFRPLDQSELRVIGHMDTGDQWRERRNILLGKARVWTRLKELIAAAKAKEASLAVFKPAQVVDFVWKPEEDREWDINKVRQMRKATGQYDLFDDNTWRETFQIVQKLPYQFFYKFKDADGRISKLRVLDWELGALFRNCRRRAGGRESSEPEALAKVKEKYLNAFLLTDLHFFLGTTLEWHFRAPNPWIIVGVLPIPPELPESQLSFL
ncbi:hypothetical protein [Candidatus Synechococcus spongiarum]|uniref:Uncharacterized protein n=1 Tax=Candidatus Synechococcus spongiarum TaxID=431041 RepID=A0A164ZSU1_9SYNE|nr:hypothetical protein [Candidatus Synechococcus spongiarum]SAY39445.1 hypothetical protein FLM9_1596 [Candidatus Synechococcus spongiarum]